VVDVVGAAPANVSASIRKPLQRWLGLKVAARVRA
jgi:hypothetical protein